MRFLVGANLPRSLAKSISNLGQAVEFARDIGLGAAPDHEIAAHVQKIGAVLFTRDLDFADVRRYPPEHSGGIIMLSLPDDLTSAGIVRVATRFLGEQKFVSQLPKRLAIVEMDRVRFRPPLRQRQRMNSTASARAQRVLANRLHPDDAGKEVCPPMVSGETSADIRGHYIFNPLHL